MFQAEREVWLIARKCNLFKRVRSDDLDPDLWGPQPSRLALVKAVLFQWRVRRGLSIRYRRALSNGD